MTLEQIIERARYLQSLPMGPERWGGDIELRSHKARCPDYRHPNQQMAFSDWIAGLREASKQFSANWGSDKIRASYYEGQPDAWVNYYDGGDSPEDAIISDMGCWD